MLKRGKCAKNVNLHNAKNFGLKNAEKNGHAFY